MTAGSQGCPEPSGPAPEPPESEGDWVQRHARIVAVGEGGVEVDWLESACRGCAGCGGRCGLFAGASARPRQRIALDPRGLAPGMDVDIGAPSVRLRRAAILGYGLALAGALCGALAGHAAGAWVGAADAGALLGLLAGTLLGARVTKRLPLPSLCARPRPRVG